MASWAIITCFVIDTGWICLGAAAITAIWHLLRRERLERLKDASTFAHEIERLKKELEIEREWMEFQRRMG